MASTVDPPVQLQTQASNAAVGSSARAAFGVQTAAALVVLLLVAEFGYLFFFRQVNLDEGWYLWASKLVYEGRLLYRDFAYTQTPVLPYVYGLTQWLLGEGLYQGRAVTIGFALGAVWLSAWVAGRIGGAAARFCTLALLAASPFALAQFSYTATYALAACLIAASLAVAMGPGSEDRRQIWAMGLACLAVGVRLSLVVILPILLLYLIWTSQRRLRALLVSSGALIGWLALILGVYFALSGELMVYDTLGFHTDRLLKQEWRQLHMRHMAERTLGDFLLLVGLTVAAGLAGGVQLWQAWRGGSARSTWPVALLLVALAGMILALFGVHLLPRTTDSYYNALQTPLMAVAGGVLLARWLAWETAARRPYLWLLIGLILAAQAGRQWQGVMRDQYLVQPPRNQIAVVRQAAALLRRFTEPGETLLSFDPHLALEAGLRVMPGYEMAIFAYRPTWTDAEAARYNVVNNRRLLADLQDGADVVAFTSFDLEQIYGERATVTALLQTRYRLLSVVPGFGPYGDELSIYLPPQFGPPPPQQPYPAVLADGIALAGYDLDQRLSAGIPTLNVAFYWRATQPPTHDYTVFVQLLDEQGVRVTGWDNPPCRNTCPTTSWRQGEFLRDEYTLALSELAPGAYTLHAGMYDPNTGERLAVQPAQGEPPRDQLLLTTIQVE